MKTFIFILVLYLSVLFSTTSCIAMRSEPMVDNIEMGFDMDGHDGGYETGVELPALPEECWVLGQDESPPMNILDCKRYNEIGIQCCERLAGDHTPETCEEEFPCECDSGAYCPCPCVNTRACVEYLSTWKNACLREFGGMEVDGGV